MFCSCVLRGLRGGGVQAEEINNVLQIRAWGGKNDFLALPRWLRLMIFLVSAATEDEGGGDAEEDEKQLMVHGGSMQNKAQVLKHKEKPRFRRSGGSGEKFGVNRVVRAVSMLWGKVCR